MKLKEENAVQSPLNDSSFHKINPVVAMDIGKPSLEVNIPTEGDYSSKKSGFKKVLYTADKSFNSNSDNELSENKQQFTFSSRDFLLEMIRAEHAVGRVIVSQNLRALQNNEEIEIDNDNKDNSDENKDSDEAVVLPCVKTDKTDNVLVNTIGKSMLSGFIHPFSEPSIERKYLSTLNRQNFVPFYGYVGKHTSLHIK